MSIAPGDTLPDIALTIASPDGPEQTDTGTFFKGRKVVLFAVPGAFTPTCSARHMPGYVEDADALRAKGVDEIACIAVNDPFVLKAWAESQGVEGRITMLADGSGVFTKAIGQELDLVARGLGVRSQRYAMIVDDGRVTHLAVEPAGEFGVSSAAAILATLG
jgi:peroxiredoxin